MAANIIKQAEGRKKGRKKWPLIIGLVLFAAVLGGIVYLWWQNGTFTPIGTQNTAQKSETCTEEEFRILTGSTESDIDKSELAGTVSSRQGYKEDASCVYAVAYQYLIERDVAQAKTEIQRLEGLKDRSSLEERGYSNPDGSIAYLKSWLETIESGARVS